MKRSSTKVLSNSLFYSSDANGIKVARLYAGHKITHFMSQGWGKLNQAEKGVNKSVEAQAAFCSSQYPSQ